MKLHTNIKQVNLGMLKSKLAWQLEYRLELTPEESELVQAYKIQEKTLAKYLDNEGKEYYTEFGAALKGALSPIYNSLNSVNTVKVALGQGCLVFRDLLRQIQEIRAGGGAETFDFPLHESTVQPAPVGPPTAPAPGTSC